MRPSFYGLHVRSVSVQPDLGALQVQVLDLISGWQLDRQKAEREKVLPFSRLTVWL